MNDIKVLIVEDQKQFVNPIVEVLRSNGFTGEVHWINPVKDNESYIPFEEILNAIPEGGLVLLDHLFGRCKYTGEHIAVSCKQSILVSISTEERAYAKFNYTYKVDLFKNIDAHVEAILLHTINQALEEWNSSPKAL